MKHVRVDYDRIQDPANLIPEDEPVFLLRGQDENAPATVEFWANHAESMKADPAIVSAAREQAVRMREYQFNNGRKTPDMPE